MSRIQIHGGIPLNGEIEIQGCKNAALPLMAAAMLHRGITVLHRCPQIRDVEYMGNILEELGAKVSFEGHTVIIDAGTVSNTVISDTYATRLRASVVLMGSLAGRCREITLPYPGGCVIGQRPIDFHLEMMRSLGAEVIVKENEISLEASGRNWEKPEVAVKLPFPSVGATQTAICAAVLRPGRTWIYGCALEPEVQELCLFLNRKGARITGVGRKRLFIEGVKALRDSEYEIMADRIVAGTYLCAAAATKGCVCLEHIQPQYLAAVLDRLLRLGTTIWAGKDRIMLDARKIRRPYGYLKTEVYPGFPTDLQSPFLAMVCALGGNYRIEETIFENRYQIAEALQRMGACLWLDGRCLMIKSSGYLKGTTVQAQELRGGAGLVIAGISAEGTTNVTSADYLKRGYEDICQDLRCLGADIEEIGSS